MRALLLGLVIAIGFGPQLSGQIPSQEPAPVQAPTGPKIQLTFEDGGKVSLVANGATLREILAEWSRKGGTPFVGAERLSGGPLVLQYDHRPETEVVGSLLRSASGVIISPRLEASVGASQIGVVYVLATSNASAATPSYSTPTYSAPPPQVSSQGSPDQEVAPIGGPGRAGQPPAQQQQAPPPAPTPAPRPAGMSGVAVPVIGYPSVTTTAPPPTPPTPPPTTTGRGGGGGGGGR